MKKKLLSTLCISAALMTFLMTSLMTSPLSAADFLPAQAVSAENIRSFPADSLTGLFNTKVSNDDIQRLAAGEIVVRNIGSARNIGIEPRADNVRAVIKGVHDLKPAYLAEIIMIPGVKQPPRAVQSAADPADAAHTVQSSVQNPAPTAGAVLELAQELENILVRVDKYAGIPYWSVQQQRFYDLYSSVKTTADRSAAGKMDVDAVIDMLPFGEFGAHILCERSGSNLLYSMISTSDMFYHGFKAVGAGKFRVYICMFEYNGIPVFYGIGGVNAPVLPFVKERIETSFINKNTTFCSFVFSETEKIFQGAR